RAGGSLYRRSDYRTVLVLSWVGPLNTPCVATSLRFTYDAVRCTSVTSNSCVWLYLSVFRMETWAAPAFYYRFQPSSVCIAYATWHLIQRRSKDGGSCRSPSRTSVLLFTSILYRCFSLLASRTFD